MSMYYHNTMAPWADSDCPPLSAYPSAHDVAGAVRRVRLRRAIRRRCVRLGLPLHDAISAMKIDALKATATMLLAVRAK